MRKILSISVVLCLIVLICGIGVNAAVDSKSIPFSLVPSVTEAKIGDTITVSLTTSSNSGMLGGGFYIDYDENIWERDASLDKKGKNSDGDNVFTFESNEEDGRIFISGASGDVQEFTTIYTFGFKVKDTAVAGNATFILTVDGDNGIQIYDEDALWGFSDFYETSDFNITNGTVKIKAFKTSTKANVANSMVFTTTITDCPDSGIIYAACYNGTTLVGCDYKVFNSAITEPVTFTMPVPTAYTGGKIFIWDADGKPLLETPEDVEI